MWLREIVPLIPITFDYFITAKKRNSYCLDKNLFEWRQAVIKIEVVRTFEFSVGFKMRKSTNFDGGDPFANKNFYTHRKQYHAISSLQHTFYEENQKLYSIGVKEKTSFARFRFAHVAVARVNCL